MHREIVPRIEGKENILAEHSGYLFSLHNLRQTFFNIQIVVMRCVRGNHHFANGHIGFGKLAEQTRGMLAQFMSHGRVHLCVQRGIHGGVDIEPVQKCGTKFIVIKKRVALLFEQLPYNRRTTLIIGFDQVPLSIGYYLYVMVPSGKEWT